MFSALRHRPRFSQTVSIPSALVGEKRPRELSQYNLLYLCSTYHLGPVCRSAISQRLLHNIPEYVCGAIVSKNSLKMKLAFIPLKF